MRNFCLWLALCAAVIVQGTSDLRAIVADRMSKVPTNPSPKRGQGVGIAVDVLTAEGLTFEAQGRIGLDRGQTPSENTIFEIGSVTKVFTALLLADMIERGEVQLDDPVAKYLPQGVNVPSRNDKPITLADLVTHTSGLPLMPSNIGATTLSNPYALYDSNRLFEFLSGFVLNRDPGEAYEYSNLGGGLLGFVLARRAGLSYEGVLKQRITAPLGMKDTTITLSEMQKKRTATGYDQRLQPVGLWDFDALAGAAAIRSTPADLLTFAAAHLELTNTPLKAAMRRMRSFRRPTRDPKQAQAMGWQVLTEYNPEIFFHQGGTHGFHAVFAIQPATRHAAVILANSLVRVDDIAKHLIDGRYPLTK